MRLKVISVDSYIVFINFFCIMALLLKIVND